MACFLDVRKTRLLANILAGSISRLLLPVPNSTKLWLGLDPKAIQVFKTEDPNHEISEKENAAAKSQPNKYLVRSQQLTSVRKMAMTSMR